MPPVRISRHARNQIRYWRLTDDDVIGALDAPDAVTPSIKGRSNAWKQTDDYLLKVTFIEERDALVVVTVGLPGRRGRPPREE